MLFQISPSGMTTMQATLDDKTRQEIKTCMDLLDKRTDVSQMFKIIKPCYHYVSKNR